MVTYAARGGKYQDQTELTLGEGVMGKNERIAKLESREAEILTILDILINGLDNISIGSPVTERLCEEAKEKLNKLSATDEDPQCV